MESPFTAIKEVLIYDVVIVIVTSQRPSEQLLRDDQKRFLAILTRSIEVCGILGWHRWVTEVTRRQESCGTV